MNITRPRSSKISMIVVFDPVDEHKVIQNSFEKTGQAGECNPDKDESFWTFTLYRVSIFNIMLTTRLEKYKAVLLQNHQGSVIMGLLNPTANKISEVEYNFNYFR